MSILIMAYKFSVSGKPECPKLICVKGPGLTPSYKIVIYNRHFYNYGVTCLRAIILRITPKGLTLLDKAKNMGYWFILF